MEDRDVRRVVRRHRILRAVRAGRPGVRLPGHRPGLGGVRPRRRVVGAPCGPAGVGHAGARDGPVRRGRVRSHHRQPGPPSDRRRPEDRRRAVPGRLPLRPGRRPAPRPQAAPADATRGLCRRRHHRHGDTRPPLAVPHRLLCRHGLPHHDREGGDPGLPAHGRRPRLRRGPRPVLRQLGPPVLPAARRLPGGHVRRHLRRRPPRPAHRLRLEDPGPGPLPDRVRPHRRRGTAPLGLRRGDGRTQAHPERLPGRGERPEPGPGGGVRRIRGAHHPVGGQLPRCRG